MKILFLLSLLTQNSIASYEEKKLRNYLFNNGYNKNVRPIRNFSHPIEIQQGIAVQTLESFDQMDESISLNLWIRSNWKDEYLNWNDSNDTELLNLDFISVSSDDIWTPDTELLNAATKPEIYLLQGGINLYQDGSILYSKPGIYTSSCSLNLEKFPFDEQNCTILIGSWVYNDNFLNLIPHNDENKQIDVLSSFSHSEWSVVNVEVRHLKEKRECCPNVEYDLLSYSFILSRYSHYYKISMGMTITLVIVSFVITLMSPSNVSRTSTAVFIPLTILALQLTIANKIPVVGYYTLMDKFFLCCFVTSMVCSIESGLMYAIITTKSTRFYNLLDKIFKYKFDDEDIIKENNKELNEEEIALEEFKAVEKALEEVAKDDNIRMRINVNNLDDSDKDKNEFIDDNNIKYNNSYLKKNNIKKIIDYDDKRLVFTKKQEKIDAIVNKHINTADNIIRIILPIVFFSYIIYIFSHDN